MIRTAPLLWLGVVIAIGVGLALGVGMAVEPHESHARPSDDCSPAQPSEPAPSSLGITPPPVPTPTVLVPPPLEGPRTLVPAEPYPLMAAQPLASDTSNTGALRAMANALLGNGGQPASGSHEYAPPATAPYRPAPATSKNEISSKPGPNGDRFWMNIQDADLRGVLDALGTKGGLNIVTSKNVMGKVSATLSDVDLDSALCAILKSTGFLVRREGSFIFVGTAEDFESMERAVDRIGTRIYHPNYIKSLELQTLITPLLTKDVGQVSVTSESKKGIGSNTTDAGGNDYAGTEAVLVRDYESVLDQIDQLVRDVDRRPMQVHIEAMILSVQLDDKDDFGVNFQLLRDNPNVRLGWGTVPANFSTFKFDGGLKFGFLDQTLGAFLDAVEKIGDTNVIATPRLMVVNKHAAEIQIGKSRGYVSTTQTETAATQTVEFLELGTLLRLRPFISADGIIRMEIHPEISDGDVKVEQGFTLPNKEVTQVTTNIMVRDGCTVVIGGLLQDEQKVNGTQIPLFGNLPVVGPLFRTRNDEIVRRELIVLITPRIVYEPEVCQEGNETACEFHRRHQVYSEKMCPVSKVALSRKYVRRAQAAWADGDQTEALRLAELAVHFDPRNRMAIDVRSDVWLGKPYGKHSLQGAPLLGPPTEALDGDQIAPWLLDRMERPAVARPVVLHPLDPGMPGAHQDLTRPTHAQGDGSCLAAPSGR
ncbi:MAG: hypothetical protein JW818_07345 [Pirellulales bacterium]|nr:hypothetical protein [Pirellulales bacterium]